MCCKTTLRAPVPGQHWLVLCYHWFSVHQWSMWNAEQLRTKGDMEGGGREVYCIVFCGIGRVGRSCVRREGGMTGRAWLTRSRASMCFSPLHGVSRAGAEMSSPIAGEGNITFPQGSTGSHRDSLLACRIPCKPFWCCGSPGAKDSSRLGCPSRELLYHHCMKAVGTMVVSNFLTKFPETSSLPEPWQEGHCCNGNILSASHISWIKNFHRWWNYHCPSSSATSAES